MDSTRFNEDWMPRTRTLAVVALHPDDETLGAGGLIYTCAELGYEITIILVTDGEATSPDQPGLAERRIDELRAALMRIAPDGAHVVRLRFPDGQVAASEGELARKLLSVVPLDCTLVGPCERGGHPDHAAASRACQAAAQKLHVPCVRYPIWASRIAPANLDTQPTGRLALTDAAREAKRQAMLCYRSQLGTLPASAANAERPYEVFLL